MEQQLRSIALKLSAEISQDTGNPAIKTLDVMFGSGLTSTNIEPGKGSILKPTFSKGNKVTGDNFSGDVWVNMLTSVDSAVSTSVGNVTFAPKARSNWHVHPSGQTLLITDGLGYYQEKGKPVRLIRKGDVVKCAPNVAHWHGASRDSSMAHIALEPNNGKGAVVWLEKVTEDEYNKVNQ